MNANLEQLRDRAATLAQRAVGGADIEKLAVLRDALYADIVAVLIAVSPRRELIDPHELGRMLNDLTGAGVHFTRRQLTVERALTQITALLDRIDPSKREPHTRPDFSRPFGYTR